jgi:RNA polymerase sigma-70 factor, ECF subfamily
MGMFGRNARKPNAPDSAPASPEADQRDRDVIAALYDRFAGRIHAYALQRLHDPDLAADITGTVFARALAALPSFDHRDDSAAEGWLLAIARNAIVDHVRADRRLTILDAETYRRHLHVTSPDPASAAVAPDERDRLLAALGHLTATQQRIVLLRVQGWNGVEIAELLGMSHGAVRAAQHRAYGRLRDLLAVDAPSKSAFIPEPDHA